jgi:hypothetical protein
VEGIFPPVFLAVTLFVALAEGLAVLPEMDLTAFFFETVFFCTVFLRGAAAIN